MPAKICVFSYINDIKGKVFYIGMPQKSNLRLRRAPQSFQRAPPEVPRAAQGLPRGSPENHRASPGASQTFPRASQSFPRASLSNDLTVEGYVDEMSKDGYGDNLMVALMARVWQCSIIVVSEHNARTWHANGEEVPGADPSAVWVAHAGEWHYYGVKRAGDVDRALVAVGADRAQGLQTRG